MPASGARAVWLHGRTARGTEVTIAAEIITNTILGVPYRLKYSGHQNPILIIKAPTLDVLGVPGGSVRGSAVCV